MQRRVSHSSDEDAKRDRRKGEDNQGSDERRLMPAKRDVGPALTISTNLAFAESHPA
jgi:hypothetical protein